MRFTCKIVRETKGRDHVENLGIDGMISQNGH